MMQKGQYNAELTLLPHFCVKPLMTAITAFHYLVHAQTSIFDLGGTGTSTTISGVVFHRVFALSTHWSLSLLPGRLLVGITA